MLASLPLLTIVSPATDRNLITLADLKQRLNITTTAQDTDLENKLLEASEIISNYCNRVLVQETVRERYNGYSWKKYINLRRTPIVSVTSIIIDNSVTPVDSDLYEFDIENEISGYIWPLDSDGRRVYFPETWGTWSSWCGNSLVDILYVGGHTQATMPYPIRAACAEMVRTRLNADKQGSNVSKIEIPGVWSKTLDTASKESNSLIPDHIKDMLFPYRRPALSR